MKQTLGPDKDPVTYKKLVRQVRYRSSALAARH